MISSDKTGSDALSVMAKASRFNQWMFETIYPYTHGNIIEIGSGIGNISGYFINKKIPVTLSDIDDDYLRILRIRFEKNQYVKDFLNIDLQHTKFKETYSNLKETFDTLFLLNVLEHLEDDNYAVQNCKYLLKKSGTLIILVPAYTWLYSRMDKELGHFRRYTLKGLSTLTEKQGLTTQKKNYFNAIGVIAWLYGKIFSLKIVPEQEIKFFDKIIPFTKLFDRFFFRKIGLSAIIVARKF